MGTQHGYSEKECKVCFTVKSREEFPAFGGLTCRECIRVRDRENYPKRYERNKQDPKYVEANRRRAREYKRRKKLEREGTPSMTPQELAGQLNGLAEGVPSGAAAELAGQMETLKQAVSNAIGDQSPGYAEIAGAANNVSAAVSTVQAALEELKTTIAAVAGRAQAV